MKYKILGKKVIKKTSLNEIAQYLISYNQSQYLVVVPRADYSAELTFLPERLNEEELALKLIKDYEALRGIKDSSDDYKILLNTMVTKIGDTKYEYS
jgi:predicted metal-dependent TIM-barrel fold hydrolase